MKKYLPLAFLTLISGILSEMVWIICFKGEISSFFVSAPGIIFGILVGTYFWLTYKTSVLKIFLWIITCGIAYYSAYYSFMFLYFYKAPGDTQGYTNSFFSTPLTQYIPILIGGFVGTTLLVLASKFLISKINMNQAGLIILIGTVLSPLFILFPATPIAALETYRYFKSSGLISAYIPFVVWQMAVGIALGMIVDRNKNV